MWRGPGCWIGYHNCGKVSTNFIRNERVDSPCRIDIPFCRLSCVLLNRTNKTHLSNTSSYKYQLLCHIVSVKAHRAQH